MKSGSTDKFDFSAARSLEGRVWDLLERREIKDAIDACEQLNRQFPEFASGWHTASQLALKLNNPTMALAAVDKALSYEPNSVMWAIQKARCLARLGEFERLSSEVDKLSSRKLETAYQLSALAMLQTQLGRREQAIDYYERVVKLRPDDARQYYNIACLQRTLGKIDAAERNFDKTISLDPGDYEAYKLRSDLRQQTPDSNHVEELEKLLDSGLDDDDDDDERGAVQISYAVAKELEDLGEAERSFRHLKAASDRRRKLMKYDVERDLETIRAIRQTFGGDVFADASGGTDNAEPIFILGMPRTGTTLVERILASHTEVFAAGELNNFAAQLMTVLRSQNIDKRISRDEMVQLSAKLDFKRLGESYVKSTRPFTGKTPRFIDKMPLNYLYVGLIHLALPKAKIINLHRDPMDTCYAIYKQLFVDAYPFSYDLEELAKYYVAYHRLMAHWNSVLPGVIHTVKYEELVDDIEGRTRQLLDACELDWQPQCLKFYENREASTTASTAQIRRPVYKSSVGKWRNYEQQLQPVVDILRQGGVLLKTDA